MQMSIQPKKRDRKSRYLSPEFSYFLALSLQLKSTVKYIIFVLLKRILSHVLQLKR